MPKRLRKVLNNIVGIQGVNAVSIISRDGFVVDYVSKSELDLEAIGAVVASGFGSSEVIGTELSIGYLNQCILEYDTNKILMASIADNILVVIADGNCIIGKIRYNIQKNVTEISKGLT